MILEDYIYHQQFIYILLILSTSIIKKLVSIPNSKMRSLSFFQGILTFYLFSIKNVILFSFSFRENSSNMKERFHLYFTQNLFFKHYMSIMDQLLTPIYVCLISKSPTYVIDKIEYDQNLPNIIWIES